MKRLAAVLALALALSPLAQAEIIHEERSLYRNILVRDQGSERCLLFTVRRSNRNQSCLDRDDPDRLIFPYARMMLSGLLVTPAPKRILMVGLGGGTLPKVFSVLTPQAQQDLVEIDEAVVTVAKRFFDFTPTAQMAVHVQDARVFLKRAAARGTTWDYIMLDAFTGDYIPEHLMTKEFLEEVRAALTDDGVLVANTFASSALYDAETATYAAVFPALAEIRLDETLNRILVAQKQPFPDEATRLAAAEALRRPLRRFASNPLPLAENFNVAPPFSASARLLTDQYAPVNLLQQR
ncbi:MAG: fused MFS/spermidine synthase [Proteobacteria bacterium]|nr:fused MFS/spermidine synthase [Pseudomonadota bacterium]